jgi:hypothetical protein
MEWWFGGRACDWVWDDCGLARICVFRQKLRHGEQVSPGFHRSAILVGCAHSSLGMGDVCRHDSLQKTLAVPESVLLCVELEESR